MISQFAIEEINNLKAQGLEPSPSDIIRLNALGLALDHHPYAPFYQFRRACRLGHAILAEPTIAHNLLIGQLANDFNLEDHATEIIVRAFVYAFPADKVPEYRAAGSFGLALKTFFRRELVGVTMRQLTVAVNYLTFGADHAALEFPDTADDDAPEEPGADGLAPSHTPAPDPYALDLMVIAAGESLGLGISLADARRHTRAELSAIIQNAVRSRDLANPNLSPRAIRDNRHDQAVGEFYVTLARIRERLTSERSASADGKVPNGQQH